MTVRDFSKCVYSHDATFEVAPGVWETAGVCARLGDDGELDVIQANRDMQTWKSRGDMHDIAHVVWVHYHQDGKPDPIDGSAINQEARYKGKSLVVWPADVSQTQMLDWFDANSHAS